MKKEAGRRHEPLQASKVWYENDDDDDDDLPNDSTDLDRGLTAKDIGQETGDESAGPGTTRHGSNDATLEVFIRAQAISLGVVVGLYRCCMSVYVVRSLTRHVTVTPHD